MHLSSDANPASGKVLRHRTVVQMHTQVKYVYTITQYDGKKSMKKMVGA